MSQSGFTVDIYQNEHIPEGGREVNAVITVTSPDTVTAAPAPGAGNAGRDSASLPTRPVRRARSFTISG